MVGKVVVARDDWLVKLKAAVEHRRTLFVVARTDARAAHGLAEAIERARAAVDLGVDDAEHGYLGQSDQQFAHAHRVNIHGGSPELDGLVDTIKFAEPLYRVRDASDPAQIRRADFQE